MKGAYFFVYMYCTKAFIHKAFLAPGISGRLIRKIMYIM